MVRCRPVRQCTIEGERTTRAERTVERSTGQPRPNANLNDKPDCGGLGGVSMPSGPVATGRVPDYGINVA